MSENTDPSRSDSFCENTDPSRSDSFLEWKKEVDNLFSSKLGLSTDDLEDRDYFNYFESDMSPEEVWDEFAEEEGLENL